MCGIYGALDLRMAEGEAREQVGAWAQASLDAIAHRGPDDQGLWVGAGITLGMRRLSIIDLAGGHQPFWSQDGMLALVYNGELYNYLDLRAELLALGWTFRTQSDTEVVLTALQQWGAAALTRFNGMFALALWDTRDQSLLLGRDRLGEKPLYYYRDAERLIFASEIKAIHADPTVPRTIASRGVVNFLTFGHAVAPQTIFEGVSKLPPAHYLRVQGGTVTITRYWHIGAEPHLDPARQYSPADLAVEVRNLLDDSVQRRMIADVPLGAFLSGGVDSSAIVALMQRHRQRQGALPVQTFSLGFTVGGTYSGTYNELPEARRVAAFLGTTHHELELAHTDLVGTLRRLIYHYDEPYGDAAAFPLYLLSQFAREHVKVALGGDGSDELFGGYRRYALDGVARAYQWLPRQLTEQLIPVLVERLPRLRRLKRAAATLPIRAAGRRYAHWLTCFSADLQAEILSTGTTLAAGYDPLALYETLYAEQPQLDHLNRLMAIDVSTWLPDGYLEKVDKATMATSLEGRLPFLDHRLVELAFQIPSALKIRGFATKQILKQAVADLIPAEVLRRPKHGFAVPTDPWFRGELSGYAREILLDERTRQRGWFNLAVVERLWNEHRAGRHAWDTQLWLLLVFELWQRVTIDGDGI